MLKFEFSCYTEWKPRGKVKTEILAIIFYQGNLIIQKMLHLEAVVWQQLKCWRNYAKCSLMPSNLTINVFSYKSENK